MKLFSTSTLITFLLIFSFCGGGGETAQDVMQDVPADAADVIEIKHECQKDDDCKDVFADLGQCEKAFCNMATNFCERGNLSDETACNDGVECTLNDVCMDGVCEGTPTEDCKCENDEQCKKHDDADLCNGTVKCIDSICKVDPATIVTCEQSQNQCKVNVCVPETGKCEESNRDDFSSCDDKDLCTENDFCKGGECTGSKKDCDDNNVCTDDDCKPEEGCVYANNAKECDDTDSCTINDKCSDGKCSGEANPECKCKEDKDCDQYEDLDLCNGTLKCVDNKCVTDPETVIKCEEAPPPCNEYICDPLSGECVLMALENLTECDDSNKCTSDDYCEEGACMGNVIDCSDKNLCTDDNCVPEKGCVYDFNAKTCDDANLCTENDKCTEGQCKGAQIAGCECASNGECSKFEDGNLCNGIMICLQNKCVVDNSTVVKCPAPSGLCKEVACEPTTGKCSEKNALNGTSCDDKNKCSTDDFCSDGACAGKKVNCDDNNICTDELCDQIEGCKYTNNNLKCDDNNPCTINDTCSVGKCLGTQVPDCQCQLDVNCEPFEDGNYCNGTLICVNKKCVVNPATIIVCKSANPCVEVTCDKATGACIEKVLPDGTKCEDGNKCTAEEICLKGECKGKDVNCDDGNLCTDDSCDGVKGCVYAYNTKPCDDGSSCTANDACANGKCKGSQISGCVCNKDEDCVFFDDGDLCNGTLKCIQNQCVFDPATVVKCDTSKDNDCKKTACDPKDGICKSVISDNGTPCGDGSVCTTVDKCLGGNCVGTVPVDCNDKNDCTKDLCNAASGCYYEAIVNSSCKDGDECTINEYCSGGKCLSGGTAVCDDKKPCTFDYCDPAKGCVFEQIPGLKCCATNEECNDNDKCTKDACAGGICVYEKVISPDCCVKNCQNKECGPDGCGGFCGVCAAGKFCDSGFKCSSACLPNCTGKECGNSGCGTSCGDCNSGEFCDAKFQCSPCLPDCAGKECGPDGCGGTCGSCDIFLNCTPEGKCTEPCLSCSLGLSCPDLGFESGSLDGWTYENDVTVQHNVGATAAPQGFYMAAVGNGVFGEGVGHLKLTLCVPKDMKRIKFAWKFYSEEFLEWCGSIYQDYFYVRAYSSSGSIDLLNAKIDDLCPANECMGCGGMYVGLATSDVEFDQGDVYNTPWQTFETDISSLTSTGEPVTLAIFVGDMGDGIYDTLILIDDIQFLP